MGTVFTSKLKRQRRVVALLLIFLWLFILGFITFCHVTILDQDPDLAESLLGLDDLLFVIAAFITVVIVLIGVIVSRLYNTLSSSLVKIDEEHNAVMKHEQEKIRLKRQLTNNINHELKTPICSILGYLEMIMNNDNIDAQTTRTFIEKSYGQAERLRCLMTDLSTIARVDEASSMVERGEVDLSKIIRDTVDDTTLQANQNNIRVINRVDDDLKVDGNETLLYSIFRNLIDNAIAYSGGRHVIIELVESSDTHYTFKVEDNGIGVEGKHLEYLFERFYRVDKGRSRKLGGTGLGLSIVKNAVVFHGGTIVAQPSRSGGLEFVFSLKR